MIQQQNWIVRATLYFNKRLGFDYPVVIPENAVKMDLEQLKGLLEQNHARLRHIA